MKKTRMATLVSGGIALIILIFFLALLLIKFLWSWTIPDLFPGAVDQGLIARDISWYTAMKLAIFVAVLTGISNSSNKDD